MASMAASSVDIHQPGKYPIVLSDALLGKPTKEVFTGLRYNHKPDPSLNSSSSSLNIRPSATDSSYELSIKENSEKYAYNGVRTSGDGQYVLIFDPVKQHFVLHRIDSTFDMNLVSTPWTQDAPTLRAQYPQLQTETKLQASAQPPQRRASKGKKAAAPKAEAPRRKVEKAKKAKPPVREPTPEEEDSDDGLTIEYPDAAPQRSYNPLPVYQRQASEEISDEDEDAEHEIYEEEHNQDVDLLKLPSPANNPIGMSDEDLELDLEAELEAEIEEAFKENNDAESDESEEE